MSRGRLRGADALSRAFCRSLALDLALEGVGPADLVTLLGVSQRHAEAIMGGYPTAFRLDLLQPLCSLAGVDLVGAMRTIEQQRDALGGDT